MEKSEHEEILEKSKRLSSIFVRRLEKILGEYPDRSELVLEKLEDRHQAKLKHDKQFLEELKEALAYSKTLRKPRRQSLTIGDSTYQRETDESHCIRERGQKKNSIMWSTIDTMNSNYQKEPDEISFSIQKDSGRDYFTDEGTSRILHGFQSHDDQSEEKLSLFQNSHQHKLDHHLKDFYLSSKAGNSKKSNFLKNLEMTPSNLVSSSYESGSGKDYLISPKNLDGKSIWKNNFFKNKTDRVELSTKTESIEHISRTDAKEYLKDIVIVRDESGNLEYPMPFFPQLSRKQNKCCRFEDIFEERSYFTQFGDNPTTKETYQVLKFIEIYDQNRAVVFVWSHGIFDVTLDYSTEKIQTHCIEEGKGIFKGKHH